MGEVYRARDTRLGREVAVKVLAERFADSAELRTRFEREAQAVAALSHPNILAIHDYGTEGSSTYAVMELLEGQTLRARLAQGPLPWRKAVEIAVAIAEGLSAAHAKGITHRDLKPENLFLLNGGSVKILDFGLAHVQPLAGGLDETSPHLPRATEAGTVLGTVGYMAPEQVRGQPADFRSDIFSLGCVVYEMVTGQRAFARDTAVETMTAILHEEPLDLRDSGKSAPSELNRIIQHCLEKSADQRFHSARDLAFALRAVEGDPSAANRYSDAAKMAGKRLALWVLTACALLGMVGLTAMFALLPQLLGGRIASQASNKSAFDSVAILPLANVTGDQEREALCEGLAEQVSSSLSQVGQIKVRPITSTMHYRGKAVDAKTVGRDLNVQAVVSGRLRQDGESLVIALELVDARDNSLVWSKQYKGSRQSILDLQDGIARDLAGKLGLRMTSEADQLLTKRYTEDPDAYILYREGIYHRNKYRLDGLKTGIEYFERAIKKDPNYALAHAGLGGCYLRLGNLYLGPKTTYAQAKQCFDKALGIENSLAEAHAGLGGAYLFNWEWSSAERELKHAIALDSNFPTQGVYGYFLAATGRLTEAVAVLQRAQQLDPLAAPQIAQIARCHIWMGRYDEAIADAKRALEQDPKFFLSSGDLGLAYSLKGMHEQAVAELQKAIDLSNGHPRIRGLLGFAYARAGQTAEARRELELLERIPEDYGAAAAIARIYTALDEKDRAFEWLQKAIDERDSGIMFLKVDPVFASLRSDQRLDAILQEMGLAEKTAAKADQPIDTLAILPLVNETGDTQNDYISDGLTEDLIDRLYRLPRLKVMSYDAVATYKGKATDARSVGRALDVRGVVTGRVRLRGEALSIVVELVDATDSSRVWGEKYDRPLTEVQGVRDTIVKEISAKLRPQTGGAEQASLKRRYTPSAEAYLHFQQGNFHWRQATESELRLALECYQRAIDKDPNYATAWSGLAGTYTMQANNGFRPPREDLPKAKAAVAKALQLDDQDDEAHRVAAVIALYFERDIAAAEQSLRAALRLNPTEPRTLHLQGACHAVRGQLAEAIRLEQQAKELDPYLVVTWVARIRFLLWAGQNDQAIVEAEKLLAENSTVPIARDYLGLAYLQNDMPDQAISTLLKARDLSRDRPTTLAYLGHAYGRAGKHVQARDVLTELTALSEQRYVPPRLVAMVHAGLGDNDQAFFWLRKAVDELDAWIIFLKADSTFTTLRSDPRFDALLRDMGLAEKPAAKTDQPIDTLAVLPFGNQSTDPEAGYLGDDVTYSLTDSLARVRELKVRPYTSAARFKPGSSDAKAAGRELQVQAVLRGSIQQRGEDILIDVELIHVGEDRRLWGDRYQGKLAQRLTLQQRIVQEVPERLRVSLTGQEKQALAKLPTQHLRAHELYILGRLEWNKRTRQGLEKSFEYFRQAIDQDPNFALAWAGLADAYVASPSNTNSPPTDFILQAKAAATKALEMDDQLAEARTTLALISGAYDWDWSEAERKFQRALALNPNYPMARFWYANHLAALGRFEAAQAEYQRAGELDPLSPVIPAVAGRCFYWARQDDAAIEQLRKTLAIDPNFWQTHIFLAQAYAQKGLYDEAIAQLEKVGTLLEGHLECTAVLGRIYAASGRSVEARQVLDELTALSKQRYVEPYFFAIIHAALGEKELACSSLEKAYQDRNRLMTFLRFEPIFDNLRDEPRFQKIIADMKFPQ